MIVKLRNVEKKFKEKFVFENFSLNIRKNKIVCILGPSGCGKTTLLNLITGSLNVDKGEIYNGSEKISYVFQEDRLLEWKSVYENIKIVARDDEKEKILKLIDKVGLSGFHNYRPAELSGGMRQRCSIARAFFYDADLMLMDEPFKSLDYNLRLKLIENLISLWEETENSIIFVTHEIDEALLLGDYIMVLSKSPVDVLKTFVIERLKKQRQLTDSYFISIRREIIDLLSKN